MRKGFCKTFKNLKHIENYIRLVVYYLIKGDYTMKSNDYNDNSDYRDGRKLEEDIPKEDLAEHKPKRTLEELGITDDKYYIVGRKNH